MTVLQVCYVMAVLRCSNSLYPRSAEPEIHDEHTPSTYACKAKKVSIKAKGLGILWAFTRLSEFMNQAHKRFKEDFNKLYQFADGSFEKQGMSLPQYLQSAQSLVMHLTFHHTIEETRLFPLLAQRIQSFDHSKGGKHLESHLAIHKGLDDLSGLVKKYKDEPSSYSPSEMRSCLDGFRDALFNHLDEEVKDLSGTNLKKYFTLEEVERMTV